VTRLAELRSQGKQFYAISWNPPNALQLGSTGEKVRQLQYMLAILSEYIASIPSVEIDGIYGRKTRGAVLSVQRRFGLPETGIVDAMTWDFIYDQYSGIENTALRSKENFPDLPQRRQLAQPAFAQKQYPVKSQSGSIQSLARNNDTSYRSTTTLTQFPGFDLAMGMQDPISLEVVR
jgi:peptidoglycan hydrolase-like protein with peptidoglycan-binding domain